MKDHELEWLCGHLGHTVDIHKSHYRATSGFIERVNIGKLMLLQDLNMAGKFSGQRLQDIDMAGMLLFLIIVSVGNSWVILVQVTTFYLKNDILCVVFIRV